MKIISLLIIFPTCLLAESIKLSCDAISREMYDTNEKINYEPPYHNELFNLDLDKGVLEIADAYIFYPLVEEDDNSYKFENGKNNNYAVLNRYTLELSTGLKKNQNLITKDTWHCKKIEKQI